MTRLPVLSGKEVYKALIKMGFKPLRQKGSHLYIRHPDGRSIVVPMKPQIGRGLLKKILNEIDVDREEFIKHLH